MAIKTRQVMVTVQASIIGGALNVIVPGSLQAKITGSGDAGGGSTVVSTVLSKKLNMTVGDDTVSDALSAFASAVLEAAGIVGKMEDLARKKDPRVTTSHAGALTSISKT